MPQNFKRKAIVGKVFFVANNVKSVFMYLNHFFSVSFIFCRNSQRMPTDVTEALLEIFMKEGKMDRTKAEELLKTLESTRHFQSETWS